PPSSQARLPPRPLPYEGTHAGCYGRSRFRGMAPHPPAAPCGSACLRLFARAAVPALRVHVCGPYPFPYLLTTLGFTDSRPAPADDLVCLVPFRTDWLTSVLRCWVT